MCPNNKKKLENKNVLTKKRNKKIKMCPNNKKESRK